MNAFFWTIEALLVLGVGGRIAGMKAALDSPGRAGGGEFADNCIGLFVRAGLLVWALCLHRGLS
jgi:hypothetical protein